MAHDVLEALRRSLDYGRELVEPALDGHDGARLKDAVLGFIDDIKAHLTPRPDLYLLVAKSKDDLVSTEGLTLAYTRRVEQLQEWIDHGLPPEPDE